MRRYLAAFALALGLTGCLGSTGPDDPSPYAGQFELESVNGAPLPFVVEETDARRVSVIAGRITLLTDWTFIDEALYLVETSSGATEVPSGFTGNYGVEGEVLTFYSQGVLAATLVDGTITINGPTSTAVYRQ